MGLKCLLAWPYSRHSRVRVGFNNACRCWCESLNVRECVCVCVFQVRLCVRPSPTDRRMRVERSACYIIQHVFPKTTGVEIILKCYKLNDGEWFLSCQWTVRTHGARYDSSSPASTWRGWHCAFDLQINWRFRLV